MPELRRVHLVGAGGAGVAALGEILLDRRIALSGSDLIANSRTAALARRGASIFTGHAAEYLPPDADCVVYSSAAAADNPELFRARELNIPCFRRGDFLGLLASSCRTVIAVSGSHGKTSVTALLTHLARKCGIDAGCLIGGTVPGMPRGASGDGTLFIAEVDESDGSHTAIFPALGVIVNADDDHAWSVGGVESLHRNFRSFASNSAILLGDPERIPECIWSGHADFRRIRLSGEDFQSDNLELALTALRLLGLAATPEMAADFPGVERRMTVRRDDRTALVIEDYAHAPAELRAALTALRRRYPGRHLRVLFQPHRYARLERYFLEFAALLKSADSCFVLPVFAAWCERGATGSADLAAAAGGVYREEPDTDLSGELLSAPSDGKPLLVAVVGAGDIDRIIPFLSGVAK